MAVDNTILLLEMPRNGGVILNDLAVKIDNGDAAIGCVREMHRMEPGITRGKKLALLLPLEPLQSQPRAIAHDLLAMD